MCMGRGPFDGLMPQGMVAAKVDSQTERGSERLRRRLRLPWPCAGGLGRGSLAGIQWDRRVLHVGTAATSAWAAAPANAGAGAPANDGTNTSESSRSRERVHSCTALHCTALHCTALHAL